MKSSGDKRGSIGSLGAEWTRNAKYIGKRLSALGTHSPGSRSHPLSTDIIKRGSREQAGSSEQVLLTCRLQAMHSIGTASVLSTAQTAEGQG